MLLSEVSVGSLPTRAARLPQHPASRPFLAPVTEDVAPDYRKLVKKPMDLSEVRRRVTSGACKDLSKLSSLIEPLIMAVMGLVVGFITVASFLPMVQLLNQI